MRFHVLHERYQFITIPFDFKQIKLKTQKHGESKRGCKCNCTHNTTRIILSSTWHLWMTQLSLKRCCMCSCGCFALHAACFPCSAASGFHLLIWHLAKSEQLLGQRGHIRSGADKKCFVCALCVSGYAHFIQGRQYWKFDPVNMNSLEGYPRYVGVDFFGCRNGRFWIWGSFCFFAME